ncbi:TCP-1 CPN60 family protein [Cyclospora cayetanensis]|uniref:TCP-1 CPN60 family protein n=1 Tax=Cyclospora cayetanensis TaxID=88456 RepID=A0A1D3D1K7_9EIME|nr:TCP-1 CPN60 family protein [Cyclospora cayetanensis]
MTDLRAKHSRLEDSKASCMGVDGETGELCNMQEKMVWDCLSVKQQIYKAAIEAVSIDSLYQYSYRAVAAALEVIPRTLAQNCGANVGMHAHALFPYCYARCLVCYMDA